VLGDKHPDTLTSMNNPASTYSNQGRWKDAEELFVQVMETFKRVLRHEHPDTLTRMASLAFTFKGQGFVSKAMALIEQCSELYAVVLGPQHPDTISSCEVLTAWHSEAT
jgi:hypothetical protein